MEGDADLQDALIQVADVAPFGAPQQLERLVLLEVLAAVELRRCPASSAGGGGSSHDMMLSLKHDDSETAFEDSWVGVYATQAIPKNKRIIHYAGEKISNQVSLKREARYIRDGHIWCFKLTNRTVIDAGVGGNDARFINHSCRPNCYIDVKDGVIWIRAARAIRRGEELTYDYNTDGEGLIECRCRPDCQRLL